MARNGVGIYSLPAAYNPVVTSTVISVAWANTTLTDLGTAITGSIAADGQTTITANLPMAGFKHTGVGDAALRTQYASAGQIQDNSLAWGGTAGGTADALTITLAPVVTAYVTGQRFLFISGASPNATTTPTLAVNGLAAKTFLRKDGTTIAAGDIPATTICEAVYNGTNMLLVSQGAALLTKLGTVTSGTWNASVVGPAYGGTGVANNAASTITISGAYASTFTLTNTTSVTFPTSGTLLSTAAAVTVAQGGTGLATLTANNVILGNGTSTPSFVAPGTSGNVLTSNGTTWTSSALTSLVAASQSQMEAATDNTVAATPANTKWNPGVAKCWIRCNDAGAIAASYNVSSISDDATGKVTITLTTAFSSANYAVTASVDQTKFVCVSSGSPNPSTTAFALKAFDVSGSSADPTFYMACAFGDQ